MSSGARARQQDAYVDLEANKPLRGGETETYGDDAQHARNSFVPTAQAVSQQQHAAFHAGGDEIPFAEAISSYDIAVRHGFVRKVFGILFAQLLLTFGYVLICTYHEGTRMYMTENPGLPMVLGISLSFGALIGMTCFGDVARKYPTNYGLLALFTVAESLLLGVVAAQEQAEVVALAVGTTVAVVAGLMLFATQTKHDFTGAAPYLFMALWTFVIYGFVASLFGLGGGRVYAAIGTLLFSAYLVFDVQLIMGGKHSKLAFGVDDYCLAALAVYLDIINIFLYILQLLSDRNR